MGPLGALIDVNYITNLLKMATNPHIVHFRELSLFLGNCTYTSSNYSHTHFHAILLSTHAIPRILIIPTVYQLLCLGVDICPKFQNGVAILVVRGPQSETLGNLVYWHCSTSLASNALSPVPWALATSDGAMIKTGKAKLMHCLEDKSHLAQRPTVGFQCYIVDRNTLLQAMVSLPSTFGELAGYVFQRLPRAQRVDFLTDSYHPRSIKGVERSRRGSSQAHLVKGPSTKVPRDWKQFLCNEEKKRRLYVQLPLR